MVYILHFWVWLNCLNMFIAAVQRNIKNMLSNSIEGTTPDVNVIPFFWCVVCVCKKFYFLFPSETFVV